MWCKSKIMKKIKKSKKGKGMAEDLQRLDEGIQNLMDGIRNTFDKAVASEQDVIGLVLSQGISMSEARKMLKVTDEVKRGSARMAQRATEIQHNYNAMLEGSIQKQQGGDA